MSMFRIAAVLVSLAVVILGAAPGTAKASSITFTLNCSMTALNTCGAPTGSFGTITLTDSVVNSNWVDIAVNLTSPAGRNINKFFLNYGNFPIPSGYGFTAAGTSLVLVSQDSEGQGVYGMAFDVVGALSPATNPFTTTLKLQKTANPDINLNAIDFDLKDANNLLYGAVNYSGAGPQEGASVSNHGVGVPEPATLALLGLGLAGLGFWRRRRIKAASE